nr:MAG TPA: hypothetical protein [Herelleviridae sp.]
MTRLMVPRLKPGTRRETPRNAIAMSRRLTR